MFYRQRILQSYNPYSGIAHPFRAMKRQRKRMNSRAKFVVVMSSTALVALLLVGTVVSKGAPPDDDKNSSTNVYRHLAVYSEVLARIRSEYVEEPDMKSVTLGALTGLLESIDPFASYMSADQYKEYLKNFDSAKGDLGLILAKKYGYITVVAAIPGSPAAKAGLTTGDMLETIKGVATRDMPLAYARLMLKGAPGSTIDLSVLRRRPEPQKMTLTRANVVSPAVESKMMPEGVGYIKVEALTAGKAKEVAAAVGALQKQGAKKLLLDLRYCAAGEPEEGIELANVFLSKGLITYATGQKYPRKDFNADPKAAISTLPLVVITNRGTASGAELAAAALAGNKRADLVGERTYGDASIRRSIPASDDGSAIILSVAKYYSPDGKSIQDNGVLPETANLVGEPEQGLDDDADAPDAAEQKAAAEEKKAGDVILKRALEVISKKS